MAKVVKIETDYRFYEAELTDEQLKLYKEDEDKFWDWDVEFEYTRDKDGGTDFQIQE